MRIKLLFCMLAVLISLPLAAQTDSEIFAPFVSRLTANAEGDIVRLTWIDSRDIQGPVYIYRSNSPFLGPNPVLGSALARVPYGIEFYVDEYPTGGNSFYFVVASDQNGRSFNYPIIFTNTINVWAVGRDRVIPPELPPDIFTGTIEAPETTSVETARREPGEFPDIIDLDEMREYLDTFSWEDWHLYYPLAPFTMKPRVFIRDLEPTHYSTEEYALASVVRGAFAARDWETAKYELIFFLSVPRGAETRSRARFYLGQCLYFTHHPQEGLFEFLTIQDQYPNEIAEWLQAVYNMINYIHYIDYI